MSEPFKFFAPLKVRFNETDLQGHVNFGQFLFYFDVGATEYHAAIGYDYDRMWAEGIDLLYAESHCNYKSPVKWPEVLNVHTRIAHLGRRSLRYQGVTSPHTTPPPSSTTPSRSISAGPATWAEREI